MLGKARSYNLQRRLQKAGTALAVVLLLVSLFLIARARLSTAADSLQKLPEIATPPKAKPTPVSSPAPAHGPISDSSTTTEYVNDPVRTGTDSEPEEYNLIQPDGTTTFVSHKPYRHP